MRTQEASRHCQDLCNLWVVLHTTGAKGALKLAKKARLRTTVRVCFAHRGLEVFTGALRVKEPSIGHVGLMTVYVLGVVIVVSRWPTIMGSFFNGLWATLGYCDLLF